MKLALAPTLFATLMLLAGCTPKPIVLTGHFAEWEKKVGAPTTPLVRAPAETANPRCLKDRVQNLKTIKEEVARIESTGNGVPLEGPWKGRDLSSFLPSQARYLRANENWIAVKESDVTACPDLPCVLNKAYANAGTSSSTGSGIEGWKIYLYSLKTGYSISARDFVPNIGGRWSETPEAVEFASERSNFFWSDTELTGLLKLAHLLPATYRLIGTQRFHRIPNGEQVPSPLWCPDGIAKADGTCRSPSTICADSWGTRDKGMIRAQRCLEEDTNPESNGISGQLYLTLSHELTHTWDRSQARGLNSQGFLAEFSDTEEWRAFSGWHLESVVKPARSGGPELHTLRWVPAPTAEGFVRAYAAGDPREDLAETAAWVRFRPNEVTERSPQKAAFLSKKLFDGRTYDSTGLLRFYEEAALKEAQPQLIELIDSCLKEAPAPARKTPRLKLDSSFPEPMVTCLSTELDRRLTIAFDNLRATEWEACDHLDRQESALRETLFDRLKTDVARLLSQDLERAPRIKAAHDLRQLLRIKIDPREAYLLCQTQPQPETCYQQLLIAGFDQYGSAFEEKLGSALSEEKTAYLSRNPFAEAKEKTSQFYKQLFAGSEPVVRAAAETRWHECLAAPPLQTLVTEPLVAPFSGGARFVASEVLNCIDSQYDSDLRIVRDEYLSRLGLTVSAPHVQAFIASQLLPEYLDVLKTLEDESAAAEDAERARRQAGVIEVLASRLKTFKADPAIKDSCARAAAAAFDSYFSHVSAAEQLPTRFAAIEDIRTQWSAETCKLLKQ